VAAPRTTTDPARHVAIDVVHAVDVDNAYSNLLLPKLLRERGINSRDAAFATELCYGTLRWQGVLDEVLASAAARDVARLDPPVRAVLRVGAYQLLHMRTPAHAAVHATVELARRVCGPKPVGLVNAVLRKVATASWSDWTSRLAPKDDDIGATAFAHGYPRWVAAAIAAALGDASDELASALSADRPVTHLVARPGRIDREELLTQAGPDATAGPWSPYAVRLAGGDPAGLAAVRSGQAGVQDEGSQLVALAAAEAGVADDGGRWLDMCAGPGGKSVLFEAALPEGGRLLSSDLQPHRAALVARSVNGRADVVVADGRAPAWAQGGFDRVFVDAPCTGLGALRRRPEVRWRRKPEDVDRLAGLQRELLDTAIQSAAPGGLVAYITCSPHPAETSAVVRELVERNAGVEAVDARPVMAGAPALGAGPDVQLWPHRHGTDAMYLALLRVRAAEHRR
jgi:16S rRNA (cytosine967-C5)-methyltransferase